MRTDANGRRYAVPGRLPDPSRYSAALQAAQAASDDETAPEPTPPDGASAPATQPAQPKRPRKKRKALTDDEVAEILADYFGDKWSQGELAHIYGVSQSTIHCIVTGKTHTHIKPAPREQD